MAFSFLRFLDHTQRRTTVGRTLLDEWSARRRDLYLTTHNTHNRQTSLPPVGFELTISAGERLQTYALDRAATGTGSCMRLSLQRGNNLTHFRTRNIQAGRLINPLNTELNPICYFLALLGAHHFLHVSRIRVHLLTFRLLMSYIYIYIYGAPILDVSRSHTTTQHSR